MSASASAKPNIRIPEELTGIAHWILWHAEIREGKPTKVPYQCNGRCASTSDPATWTSYENVLRALREDPERFTGLGFVFSEQDPFAGIDLDDCLEENESLKPWAVPILEPFAGSYSEISPSGRGIKLFIKAKLQGLGRAVPHMDGRIEIYDRGRFFTVTGRAFQGAPLSVVDCQSAARALYDRLKPSPRRKADLRTIGKVPSGQRYNFLLSIAGQFHARGMGYHEILEAVKAVNKSRCDPPKPENKLTPIVDYVCSKPPGFSSRQGPRHSPEEAPPPLENKDVPDLLTGFQPEDVGNAHRLVKMYGDRLRFCHLFDKWLVWGGRRWLIDHSDLARKLTQEAMRQFAVQAVAANNEAATKFAAQSRKSTRISNAMREAQPHLAISPRELDRQPYLLNFLNATVDLRTGEVQAPNRDHYITKVIHYSYNPDAQCPTFMAFLSRIMGCEPDASEVQRAQAERLVSYLQKALGYSLTGVTIEKAVFLLYGRGDNGKSTLLSTFLRLVEEYSVLLQIDTLMAHDRESNNAQADLADLRGARFVMTSETEKGQRLAEGKLKRITQGMGKIKAARKYENPIEFDESHKLWIDANHLPILHGTDNAIWSRLHPIPFNATIPKMEQDPQLPSKLLAEAEGILAWAVDGARRWYNERLGKPPEVCLIGERWRSECSQVGRFLEERCLRKPGLQVRARALYEDYKQWADDVGERTESERAFANHMRELIYDSEAHKREDENGVFYDGLGLRRA